MEPREYLNSVVGELMADTEWKLPPQLRFFLLNDLAWTLFGL